MVYAGIIIALIGLAWYAIRFYAWLRTIFTVLVILVAMSIHAQPFAKMTGTGAYGGLVTYSPAAQKWDQRTALQWWRLTPSYFRAAVRDSVFALSGDTAALVLGLDPYGQGTPVTIGSGLSLDAGVLTGSGGISGAGVDRYLTRWSGTGTIDTSVVYETTGGRIGIGTTAPTHRLSVNVPWTGNLATFFDGVYTFNIGYYGSTTGANRWSVYRNSSHTNYDNSTGNHYFRSGGSLLGTVASNGDYTAQGNIYANGGTLVLTSEIDGSTTNEIQAIDSLYLSGTTLHASLSSDGVPTKTVDLSSLQDGTGTDAQTLSWSGGTGEITISGGNTIDIDGRYLESEVDGSTTNELQTIDTFQLFGSTLYSSLSSDGQPAKTVSLAGFLDNTDAQTLSFSNPNLSISGGNSVDISALVPAYKSGHTSGTTTGGGNLSVTHSFPSGTPTVVLVTLGSTTPVGVTVRVVSISSTTFGLNFYNTGTSAALASTAVDVYWRVE